MRTCFSPPGYWARHAGKVVRVIGGGPSVRRLRLHHRGWRWSGRELGRGVGPLMPGNSGDGKRRMSGGKSSKRGTPQGGVASPLLANTDMNRFLKHWLVCRRGEAFRAHVVNYADDFVTLCGYAAEALAWTKAAMTKLGLTLNEAKTLVKNARKESFDFLGYRRRGRRCRHHDHVQGVWVRNSAFRKLKAQPDKADSWPASSKAVVHSFAVIPRRAAHDAWGPIADAERHDSPGPIGELVPGVAAVVVGSGRRWGGRI